MRELYVGQCDQTDEEGGRHCFNYYILIDEITCAGGLVCENYGAKISIPGGESASVPDLTLSAGRIEAFAALLMRNCVTPSTLRDVVEDWL